MIYPWQQTEWQQLLSAKRANRLPHGLLFSGVAGIGKAYFANHFSHALLCEQLKNDLPCYECHACRLIKGRTHPNLLWVEPEKAGQAIKVDQVRLLNEFVQQSALQGEYRVVIIHPANNMNVNAANALLKTLEEPSQGAILILISDQNGQLPATILSRCQRIQFTKPKKEMALNWLEAATKEKEVDLELLLNIANGAPLAALSLIESDILALRKLIYDGLCDLLLKKTDPIKLASKLQEMDLDYFLDLTMRFIMDMMHLQLRNDAIMNTDYRKALTELMPNFTLHQLTQLLDILQPLRSQAQRGIHFNKQLMMESVLIKWVEQA